MLGLAVSGGPDSMAMLLLSAAAFPGEIEAATVDHGLRPESAGEAALVADLCARLGCPHRTLRVAVPDGPAGLQGEARSARYAALRSWAAERGIHTLTTAHHADDQAETIMMRLQRGAGISGLSGVRPRRQEGALVLLRPLLSWTRQELREIVRASGISAVDDPSNRNERFDRVAMRNFLAAHTGFEARRLVRSAAALAEADDALNWSIEKLALERLSKSAGEVSFEVDGLPREYRRRLLRHAIIHVRREHELEPEWTGSEDVEGLLVELDAGRTATLAGVMARAASGVWRVRVAPPRREVRPPVSG